MKSTTGFVVQEGMEVALQADEREAREALVSAPALAEAPVTDEPWWPEEKAVAGTPAEYPAQAAGSPMYVANPAAQAQAWAGHAEVPAGQAAIATQHTAARADLDVQALALAPMAAKTVLNAPEGFRNGYLTLTDANGTILNISDNVTPSNVHLHTVQDSFIHGHATANDEINITSATHHAVYGSLITTGGSTPGPAQDGQNKVTIGADRWQEAPSYDTIEEYASVNGHTVSAWSTRRWWHPVHPLLIYTDKFAACTERTPRERPAWSAVTTGIGSEFLAGNTACTTQACMRAVVTTMFSCLVMAV